MSGYTKYGKANGAAVEAADFGRKLAPLSVRITATLKERLQAAAEGNGRSISAEVESRLEDLFNKEGALAALQELRTTRTRLEASLDEVKVQLAALAR